ncbi:hypothetical protein [Paraburkholderia terrae]
MNARQTYQAFVFASHTARMAARFGLKTGLKKAAMRVNPITLALDTAFSVLDAADSWLKLRAARAKRDGLDSVIDKDKRRLEVEREQLASEIEIAKKELALQADARERIGQLALLCGRAVHTLMAEMAEVRRAALPDLEEFEKVSRRMENAWDQMLLVMEHFQQTTT